MSSSDVSANHVKSLKVFDRVVVIWRSFFSEHAPTRSQTPQYVTNSRERLEVVPVNDVVGESRPSSFTTSPHVSIEVGGSIMACTP